MAAPRTVQLFLMDGSPNGRIKCSLDNWVGKVYLIPRTEITRSKDRPELAQTGIYLLFGLTPKPATNFSMWDRHANGRTVTVCLPG